MDLNFGGLPDRGVNSQVVFLVKGVMVCRIGFRDNNRKGCGLGYLGNACATVADAHRGTNIRFFLVRIIRLGGYGGFTWVNLGKSITAWQAGQEGDVQCKDDFNQVHTVKVKQYLVGFQTSSLSFLNPTCLYLTLVVP